MHVAKYTLSNSGRLLSHYQREGGLFADMFSPNKKNKNIDWMKTEQNYNFIETRGTDFIKQRCSEVRCLNRADVVVMCDWVVTIPQMLLQVHPGREKDFFKYAFQYMADKYGLENTISACVHVDEKTPHLHYAWVPVVSDRKRGGQKVCAKECLNRQDLKEIHEDMSRYLTEKLGIEVDLLTGGTISKDLTVDQLKSKRFQELQSVTDQVEQKRSELQEIEQEIGLLLEKMETSIKTLHEAERRSVIREIESLQRVRTR